MPKATRAKTDKETPKKRSRNAKPAEGNGTDVEQPVTTAPALADTTPEVVATEIAVEPAPQQMGAKETPKKRPRKAKSAEGNGTDAVAAAPVIATTISRVTAAEAPASPAPQKQKTVVSEESVRRRAYEIYLRRRGQGGSPEQDWFQALQEISGQHVA